MRPAEKSGKDATRRRFLGLSSRCAASPRRPPWAVEGHRFTTLCTRCSACANACPTRIIVRGDGGYPEVDFGRGACTFCGACVEACRTGALDRPAPAVEPWRLVAHIGPRCLAFNRIECRVCGERCESGAIKFQQAVGQVSQPLVLTRACSGCGACSGTCPAGAIRIDQAVEAMPA